MFVAYFAVYLQRSHVAVTLVAMLNSTYVVHHQQQQQRPHRQVPEDVNLTRRRADCTPFPRRDNSVRAASTSPVCPPKRVWNQLPDSLNALSPLSGGVAQW